MISIWSGSTPRFPRLKKSRTWSPWTCTNVSSHLLHQETSSGCHRELSIVRSHNQRVALSPHRIAWGAITSIATRKLQWSFKSPSPPSQMRAALYASSRSLWLYWTVTPRLNRPLPREGTCATLAVEQKTMKSSRFSLKKWRKSIIPALLTWLMAAHLKLAKVTNSFT